MSINNNDILPPEAEGSATDLVYCWCDGSDPVFAARKDARLRELGVVPDAENTGAKRYVQHDELRYALRSAHRHAPWIRRIFIVTDRQHPAWLAEHPKVTVVDHREIIPAELLPSFSSACIEGYLDRIPGLAERFIYGNDDMFFNRRARPKDFFDDSGRPIVRIARPYVSEAEAAAMAQSRP